MARVSVSRVSVIYDIGFCRLHGIRKLLIPDPQDAARRAEQLQAACPRPDPLLVAEQHSRDFKRRARIIAEVEGEGGPLMERLARYASRYRLSVRTLQRWLSRYRTSLRR